jgi:hypothetical protein
MYKLVWLPFCLILTSCATHLSQEQCMNTNWNLEGFRDGQVGKMPKDLKGAIEDCSEFHIGVDTNQYSQGWRNGAKEYCTPNEQTGLLDGQSGLPVIAINARLPICTRAGVILDVSKYQIGYKEGLTHFCTFENGSNIAMTGQRLPNVCTKELNANFSKGWQAGQQVYCQQTINAFALGKERQAYPEACPANLYIGFKSEYDRGYAISMQMESTASRLREIDRFISSRRHKYDLEHSSQGYYRLGRDKSPEANRAVQEVNNLVRERANVEREVFNLSVMR